MKKYLFLIMGMCMLFACTENERMTYSEKSAVYYPDYVEGADSLVYSFTIKARDVDTILIKVKLLGALLEKPGAFRVEAGENSTAVADRHYKALPAQFLFGADMSYVYFPVEVRNPEGELDDKTVMLELNLKATEDLDTGYPDRLSMRLMLTNRLIKPAYWDELLQLYFGEYSRVKHEKCVEMMGHDFPLTKEECYGYGGMNSYRYWMNWGRVLCEYYANNPTLDEDGNLITVWNPF